MPNRELREAIRTSEKAAVLSDSAFRLFVLLLSAADDFGRFHADARLVRAACYPFDTHTLAAVDTALSELSDKEMVVTYAVAGRDYLEILQWKQRRRANASKYPDPRDLGLMTDECLTDDGQSQDIRARGARSEERGANDGEVTERWNALAKKHGLPSLLRMTSQRRVKLRRRMAEFDNFWSVVEAEVPRLAPFARGLSDRKWKMDFDFIVRNEDNFLKLSEGKYRDTKRKANIV